jgi:hypothetical protein
MYNSPNDGNDYPAAIVLDEQGNVIVTGSSTKDFASVMKYTTIKLSQRGQELWVREFSGGIPFTIRVDKSSRVFVGGSGGVVAYSNSGEQAWTYSNSGFGSGFVLDRVGNVYVGGRSEILKFDTTFTLCARIPIYFAYDIAVDDSLNLYILESHALSKYSLSGIRLWTQGVKGTKIFLDRSGNAIVSNYYAATDSMVTKIGSQGTIEWARGTDATWALQNGLALDRDGNVYLSVGKRSTLEADYNFVTTKYSSSGEREWNATAKSEFGFSQVPLATAVDAAGNVYVGGIAGRRNFSSEIVVTKIERTVLAVDEQADEMPGEFALEQNYPNPFNPNTNIRFGVQNLGFVSLKAYDILGREVATIVNEELKAGNYRVDFDATNLASGIYFYRLTSGNSVATRKMIVVK